MNKLFLLVFAALLASLELSAENKAYVALKEASLYIVNKSNLVEKTLEEKVAKGDTVYATPETLKYLEEKKDKGVTRIPIEYKGIKASIYVDNIHPIRLEAGDTLTYLSDSKVEIGSFREQKIIPAMEWAMNITKDPMQWIYLALIAIGCALAFSFLINIKGLGLIGLTLVGVSLAIVSGAEVMYYLSYEPHALWFLNSSIVNGWGHVILNFIILAAVIACQAFLFYHVWDSSFSINDPLAVRLPKRRKDEFDDEFDDDEEAKTTPDWIVNIAFIPALIGIACIFLLLFEASAICYYILGAILIGGAITGAVYQFAQGRLLPGVIFPVCYLADSIGLILMVFTLTFVLILVAIVGAIIGAVAAFALSFIIGIIKGPEKVAFTDRYGKVHTGSRYVGGKVKSDQDGKMYKLND